MEKFTDRHIGISEEDSKIMLKTLGIKSLDDLIDKTIPQHIRTEKELNLPEGVTEHLALKELAAKFAHVPQAKSLIGQGYYDCLIPPTIMRNMMENPGWYTSYTPYQAEISQGRLELLFYFQTLVCELTGLPIANASLLDEATAIAEGIGIAVRHYREKRKKVLLANSLHPQNLQVIETRCKQIDVEVFKGGAEQVNLDNSFAAVVIQSPDTYGEISDFTKLIEEAKTLGCLVIFSADPMALLLQETPAKQGADIVVGNMQRYGVPMGNGGPHAAYMAVAEKFTRLIPGRLVGESIDAHGNKAYRLTLQTREQHIRREKATSNICTAQALLANLNSAYAIWHGPRRLINIATQIHSLAARLNESLKGHKEYKVLNKMFFDTLTIKVRRSKAVLDRGEAEGLIFRHIDDETIGISFDETCSEKTLNKLANVFSVNIAKSNTKLLLNKKARGKEFLSQSNFHLNRSETAIMRYLRSLVNKDLALDRCMIPLGSCTMKLNAASEMVPISWKQIAKVHPFSPKKYLQGYENMIDELGEWLSEITGFAKVSLQPNSGSQGEFAGLLAIKSYHISQGDEKRDLCLIPESAHGTNPASAQMAGMDILVVKCDKLGNVDVQDLQEKATKHKDRLAALMITYPSTHGVFEDGIKDICTIIHENGGQVYLDGANLNAMVGLVLPKELGADVCHMNLHKTFCIPHGGGGPGVGPIGVAEHLVPFLPTTESNGDNRVTSAPNGSASILPISWMYIRLLGGEGLKEVTKYAILSANYVAKELEDVFPVLYKGKNGLIAHECILDARIVRDSIGVSVEDIAKRLIDYGFHAPTISFPVIGTMMIEPTESEPLEELNRFIDAIKAIRSEIAKIESGEWSLENNPLSNAPHTMEVVTDDNYSLPYDRSTAIMNSKSFGKYWAPVGRVDNVHGDRNLVCSCPPLDSYK